MQRRNDPFAAPQPHLPVRNMPSAAPDPDDSSTGPAYLCFDRYKVVAVSEDLTTYTRTLRVAHWSSVVTSSGADAGSMKADGCIHLRGEWYHTECEPDDTLHLCSLSGRYRTEPSALPVVLHTAPPQGSDADDDLVLVLHPDTLLTPTNISETVTCMRRAVLKMRLGSSGLSSRPAVMGTMRHDLFEKCMQEKNFAREFANQQVSHIVRSHAEALLGCEWYSEAEAKGQLMEGLPQMQEFAANYCAFGHRSGPTQMVFRPDGQGLAASQGSRLQGHGIHADVLYCAQSVYATEEAAVSPELGLKGFVDATLIANTKPYGSDEQPQQAMMAVELKTGHQQNPQNEHMAQLALYTLMLRMRRGSAASASDPNSPHRVTASKGRYRSLGNGAAMGGMLLYLNHKGMHALHVSPMLSEIRSLIGQRNALAIESRKSAKPRGIILSYESEAGRDGRSNPSKSTEQIEILAAPPAKLPEMASASSCSRCYSKRECMMYAASDGANISSIQKSHGHLINHFTGHLSSEEFQYFLDWDRMLDLEGRAGRRDMAKAWLESSREREQDTSKTFSDLIFANSSKLGEHLAKEEACSLIRDDISKIILRFDRAPRSTMTALLSNLKVERNSQVVLSTDGTTTSSKPGSEAFRHQMNVFRGSVENVIGNSVYIRGSKNDVLRVEDLIALHRKINAEGKNPLKFRLDKDDIATGMGTLKQNLIKLFTAEVGDYKEARKPNLSQSNEKDKVDHKLQQRMPWLRRMIIEMKRPQFNAEMGNAMLNATCFADAPKIKGCNFQQLATEYSQLNIDQKHAVEQVVLAKDYAIIQGLPGTGKTSTIAFVARLLAAQGKRVLITSYTHAAVDNLIMKLMAEGLHSLSDGNQPRGASDLIRIGSKSSCHSEVHPILVQQVASAIEGEEGDRPSAMTLHNVITSARIVGCTALTVPRTPLLTKQHFDVVIVDEAGQISQPAILGALMVADSFVLVGDHMQLPPLVADAAAGKAGYGESLLKRLAGKHPESVAKLTLQYRMHEHICSLCNDIVYKGELKCATEEVRNGKLLLPRYPRAVPPKLIEQSSRDRGWLHRVLDPGLPSVFVDTDAIGIANGAFQGLERTTGRRHGGNVVNEIELQLVRQVARSLLKCGLSCANIGVICPYRSQLRLLDEDKFLGKMKRSGLEISTIDRYQGRDKDAIILSFVRSNVEGRSGRLLDDFRRLNVAVSRAKRKLILIGSMQTLTKGSEILRPILQKMERQGWLERLPPNAMHLYEPLSSMTQSI